MTQIITAAEARSKAFHESLVDGLHREMDVLERAECRRLGLPFLPWHKRHWDGPGTTYRASETLAEMSASAAAVGPTASLLSVLTREALEPIQPSYMKQIGMRFHLFANGTISTTATVPTYQLQLVTGSAYANPLTSGQMLAQNATITPAAAANLDWYLDVIMTIRATGSSGSILAVGRLINNWAASATYVITPFKNATPPTAVVVTNTGGLLVPLYFDLEIIMGAATAGNTITCLDYELISK